MKLKILAPISILITLASSSQASSAPNKKAFVPQKKSSTDSHVSLESGHQVSLSDDLNAIVDKALIDDIEMLSAMLSTIVKRENPRVYDLYTQLRKYGIDRAADPNNTEAFEKMKS